METFGHQQERLLALEEGRTRSGDLLVGRILRDRGKRHELSFAQVVDDAHEVEVRRDDDDRV